MRKTLLITIIAAFMGSGLVSCVTSRPHHGPRWENPRHPRPPKKKKPKKKKPKPPVPPKDNHRTFDDWH